MSRKPWFWILLAVIGVGATVFAARFFSRTFPIVTLDLRMDRTGALLAARDLATQNGWGPRSFRQAAAFDVDDTVKTFVELEAGGADAFRAMIREDRYQAYTWRVRHFRPGETRETAVLFTPAGRPYGFRETLPEDEPGPAISADSAQALAETAATRDWGVDLSRYALVERSEERRPGGRVDHVVVYERRDAVVGEGRYRLTLGVGGDRLTALTHTLRVPESFSRRYESMRAVNEAIETGAVIVTFLLFVIGGCLVGSVLLWRRRAALVRPAVGWGVALALLITLAQVNEWPLRWMSYDTALSTGSFTARAVLTWLVTFLSDAGLVVVSLLAAEGLGRLAFPRHPQLWRVGSREAAGTKPIAGRVAGGMVLTGIELGYVIGFYLLASRLWHWWTPAESNVNPNVLATYVPWLNAVAISAHAGLWEEALFRAVPLSCAALLGARLGHRKLWIGAALVLQALVFGGAHAGYASVPAYSRPVELILPSLLWGVVYLRYGLVPSVIAHYLFDLALLSIPLFTSSAAGAYVDQTVVVVAGLVPALAVIVGRMRNSRQVELPEALRNSAFVPPPEPQAAPPAAAPAPGPLASPPSRSRTLRAIAALGLVAWATLGSFRTDGPPLRIGRGDAVARARQTLAGIGLPTSQGWRALALADAGDGEAGRFAWRRFGRDTFVALIGRELPGPGWTVRFARTQGDVAARAEEWRVELSADGVVRSVRHRLPESRPGDSLALPQARTLAFAAVRERLGADPATMREVAAQATRQPKRTDWQITFADTTAPRLPAGERRARIEISGSEVTSARRFVFVPEDWQRAERERETRMMPLRASRVLAIVLVMTFGLAIAVVGLSRAGAWREMLGPFAVIAAIGLLNGFGRWPDLVAGLSTARPWDLQIGVLSVMLGVGQLVIAATLALIVAGSRYASGARASVREATASGIMAGAVAAGALVLAARVGGASGPLWPAYESANTLVPMLGQAIGALNTAVVRGAILLGGFAFLNIWSAAGPWRARIAVAVAGVVGGLVAHPGVADTPGGWLAEWGIVAAAMAALYAGVYRPLPAAVPWTVATLAVLQSLRAAARGGHPDLLAGVGLAVALAVVLAILATRALAPASPPQTSPTA